MKSFSKMKIMIMTKNIPARFAVVAGVAVCCMVALRLRADDWPQWGGTSHRNMYSPASGLPDRVEPGKFKHGTDEVDLATTKNVKWVAKLGSQAYGNATVAGGKVFIGTNNDSPRDPQHQGDRSILMCFDERPASSSGSSSFPSWPPAKSTTGKISACSPHRPSRATAFIL